MLYLSFPLYLSVKFLMRVKQLWLYFEQNSQPRIKFQNLSIPYPETEFTVVFNHTKFRKIQSYYQQETNLFYTQCSKIIVHIKQENLACLNHAITSLLHKNDLTIVIDLSLSVVNKIYLQHTLYNFQKQQCQTNKAFILEMAIEDVLDVALLSGDLLVNYLSIVQDSDNDNSISFEILSKLKITQSLEIRLANNKTFIESKIKCECPPELYMSIYDLKANWAEQYLKLLKGFCKFENLKYLAIHQTYCKVAFSPAVYSLYKRIGDFKNIISLTMPISPDGYVNLAVMQMLKSLKKLKNLMLQTLQYIQQIGQVIHQMSEFAIELMIQLRYLQFGITQKDFKIGKLKLRVQPLIIKINNFSTPLFIYDSQYGLRNLSFNTKPS
ncbi:hypothetical protein FGO68_gene6456 [Halteria grandinella]|uniref:Uncharacterized protein n=1 Tax=Halteria grandinella TaxID=5974 RepID=A0A8J8NSJ3_HALGN|nr:hypothetical protein FGO68_gene6456 [Halteria grandinella]